MGPSGSASIADEAGLVGDVRLVEPGRPRQGGVDRRVVVAARRLGPDRRRVVAVGGVVVELQVERPARGGAVDLAHRTVGELVLLVVAAPNRGRSERAARGVLAAEIPVVRAAEGAADGAVMVQGVAVVEAGRIVGRVGLPLVPAGRHRRRRVVGSRAAVLVEELAQVDGAVAGPVQPDGEVVPVDLVAAERDPSAPRRGVAEHAGVVRVAAAEQGRTGGAAERVGGHVAAEGDPVLADQVERLRHRPDPVAERRDPRRAQLGEGLVVGLDDDDVGALVGRRGGASAGAGRTEHDQQRQQCCREDRGALFPQSAAHRHSPSKPASLREFRHASGINSRRLLRSASGGGGVVGRLRSASGAAGLSADSAPRPGRPGWQAGAVARFYDPNRVCAEPSPVDPWDLRSR